MDGDLSRVSSLIADWLRNRNNGAGDCLFVLCGESVFPPKKEQRSSYSNSSARTTRPNEAAVFVL